MASLVSLLMTDIVGSTRRWAVDDAAMAADLELHDRLLREVVLATGGAVVKHTGDGMLAVFGDPAAAVGAAAGIQRVVGGASWRHAEGVQVRAAVHTGTVHQRDDDVFGTAVNKVARILGVCPPGGVLVSSVVVELLHERGPEGLGLAPAGRVQLAGFTNPDDVWAVIGSGLTVDPVGPGAVDPGLVPGRTLPPVDDELVGRGTESAALWDLLARHHLVTLVGVGGMGKTRLALDIAHGAQARLPQGAWWIDLSVATSADAVVHVAMATVDARELPGRSPLESLCSRLSSGEALVVVDNCEHVLPAAKAMVTAIRRSAPGVRILCTSREALDLRGEQVLPLGSLPESDGAELFRERARAVNPDLDLHTDPAAILRICARLDGIPLAIELAAARCRSMTPAEIEARLDDRFRLLRSGRPGAERHRTLRAAVEWSSSLLDDDERHVCNSLSVFAGGTLVDGLSAVTGLDDLEVLDVLDRLVARSMVTTANTPLGTRYGQLETLRQFAEEQLVAAGTAGVTRDRHLAWVCSLATWIDGATGTPQAGDAFRRFSAEIDNLRVAVAHARSTGREAVAHDIVAATSFAAFSRPAWETIEWVRPFSPDGAWTDARAVCVSAAAWIDGHRAVSGDRSSSVDTIPDRFLAAAIPTAWNVAFTLAQQGRGDEGIEILRRVDARNDQERCRIDSVRSGVQVLSAIAAADLETAAEEGLVTLDRCRRLGDDLLTAQAAMFVAFLLMRAGRSAEAQQCALEGIERSERIGASYVADFAHAGLMSALAATHPSDGSLPPATLAGRLADQLDLALERNHMYLAGSLCTPSAVLIASSDPNLAALGLAAWARATGQPPVDPASLGLALQNPAVMDSVMDSVMDAATARAASTSLRDVVEMIVPALRRVAETSGGGR